MYFTLMSMILISYSLANSICIKQYWVYFNVSFKAPPCYYACQIIYGISTTGSNQDEANRKVVSHTHASLNTSFPASTKSINVLIHILALTVTADESYERDEAMNHFKNHGTWETAYSNTGMIADEKVSTMTSVKKHNNISKHVTLEWTNILVTYQYEYEVRREDCTPILEPTKPNHLSKSSVEQASIMTTTVEYEELSTYDEMTSAPMLVMTIAMVTSFVMVFNVAWCWIINPPDFNQTKKKLKK